ncbi:MAG: DUF4190 domain-containing protein [Acidimicrobiales bacterium]
MSMPPYGPQDQRPDSPYPQQQSPYHPYPYGHGYPYGGVEHPKGTVVLVLGILSIAACQVLGPFAWVMGSKALQEIDMNPAVYSNRGVVQAGRICGIVGTVLLGLTALYLVFILFTLGAFLTSAGS